MNELMSPTAEQGPELSDEQYELLRSAVREGYFEVPRRITLVELAAVCGVSDLEASAQLRHGLDVVVRDAIIGN